MQFIDIYNYFLNIINYYYTYFHDKIHVYRYMYIDNNKIYFAYDANNEMDKEHNYYK